MALVTLCAIIDSITIPHQEIMIRAMTVTVEASGVALGADMRFHAPGGIGSRTNQAGPRSPIKVTLAAVGTMHSGNNFALRRSSADSPRTVTTLTGTNPGKGAIALVVAPVLDLPIGMTIQASYRGSGHDHVIDRGKASSNIRCPGGIMAQATVVTVQGQDAISPRPSVGKQWILC